MRVDWTWAGDTDSEAGRALLREQFRTLRDQIPIMYLVMCVSSGSLSLATYGSVHPLLNLGLPIALCAVCLVRMGMWLTWRQDDPSPTRIRRKLVVTLVLGTLLASAFAAWCVLLFPNASQVQRTCIGLFMFTATISCCFCLQSFPPAARTMLAIGTIPVSMLLLFEGDPLLRGLGINLIFVALLIRRILTTNHSGFIEVLSSRSRLLEERERALEAERRAHELAYRDPLTALPNRRALSERLGSIVGRTAGIDRAALLIVDLDRFKQVNDVHGHPAGDALLRVVADRLRALTAGVGEAYRLGGDEFALIVDLALATDGIEALAGRLVEALAQPIDGGRLVHHIGASVGIALFPRDAQDRETMMRKADVALYEAKTGGRGAYCMFQPGMDDLIRHRSLMEKQLRLDVASDSLTAFLQPVVELSSRDVIGFELLARWSQNGRFSVGPEQFIPIAEECGLINQLMLTLLQQGCRYAASLGETRPIAVNISPVQLKDPLLADRILAVLQECNYPPPRLGIEITENALISDTDAALRTIDALKSRGVQIALDDFGTGYSSLRHLHLLPFDKIKIDRSFVTSLGTDREALKIVRAIISLAGSMDLCVVAEGVESEDVALQLQGLGCAQGQGYHFGRPFPAHMVAAVLARPKTRTVLPLRLAGIQKTRGSSEL